MKKRHFKQDAFRKARGGYSRWLQLYCDVCRHPLFRYQKDGSGMLKRLYIDRIENSPVGSQLICKGCKMVLGIRTIYKKEKRPAYRLFVGAVTKKIVKGDK